MSWYNEPVIPLPCILPRGARMRHYCKGTTVPEGAVRLPNVGLCDHTYLYHIVRNYDDLAPVTVFLPGSWYQGWKRVLTWYVLASVTLGNRTCLPAVPAIGVMDFKLDSWQSSHPHNRAPQTTLLPAFPRPFGPWFCANFPGEELGPVVFKGVFAASAESIRKRPRCFYAKLLRQVDHHPRPEASHMCERAWGSILSLPASPGGQ